MAGMRSLEFAQQATLWSTYAVTNWRNGVVELPHGKAAKVKEMSTPEIVLKRAGAEVALALLFVASLVEGVVRSIIELISLGFKACASEESGECELLNDRFVKELTFNMVFVPVSILTMLRYNITDDQIGPTRCYFQLRDNYCDCLPGSF